MPKIIKDKILLLGANDQAMLSVARQLCKISYQIDVADWQTMSAVKSRYINSYKKLSDIELNAEKFVNDLVNTIKSTNYLFLLPINDVALEVCRNYHDLISKHIKIIALPDKNSYKYAHNKHELIEKCKEIGLKVPYSIYIETLDELNALLPQIKYPVIVKPVCSKLIKDNKLFQFRVKKVYKEQKLIDVVRENIMNTGILIQEVIEGFGAGYNVLAKDGEIHLAYQHERINEPLGGGASSYRKTNPINKYNLKVLSEKLITEIKWSGPAMVEYKIRNDEAYIMEINGRFWGSIELGIFAGLNYPVKTVDLFYFNKQIAYQENNKTVFARNFKMDLRYMVQRVMRYKSVKPFFKWLASLTNIFRGKEIVEDSLLRDFGLESYNYLLYLKKLLMMFVSRFTYKNTKLKPDLPEINKGMKIAFVCYGNICRSPFAELYATKHYKNYQFFSFGLIKQENRLSPVNAIEAADKWELDIKVHSSHFLTTEAVQKMDIIFIMDKMNYVMFKELYKDFLNKVYYLNPEAEIQDPFKQETGYFESIYDIIADNIDKQMTRQ